MPINNGTNSYNIGRDCNIVFVMPSGQVQLDNITDFDCKQETVAINIDRLDGIQLNADIPKGWTGSFSISRNNGALDDAFAKLEDAWYTGGNYQVSTLYQYVTESDGSRSVYQFDSCSVKLSDAGTWKGDADVKQKVEFRSNRRRKV